jgi:anti-sigma B factor antagonist
MPDLPLSVEMVQRNNTDVPILRISGPLTLSNLFEFRSTVRAGDTRSTVVAMTSVPYVDSAEIGCLIGAHVSHQRSGRKFALVGVNERNRNVLKITNVENIFSLYDTLDAAISATAQAAGA